MKHLSMATLAMKAEMKKKMQEKMKKNHAGQGGHGQGGHH